MQSLFEQYRNLVVLDVETTSLDHKVGSIIEVAALLVRAYAEGGLRVIKCLDTLVRLPVGRKIPEEIESLTGITDEALAAKGIAQHEAASALAHLMQTNSTLFIGYNVQFDLLFVRELLSKEDRSLPEKLATLDILSLFRGRRGRPCRLSDAIVAYNLRDRVQNNHRAVSDAVACLEVLRAMGEECDDLASHINIFDDNLVQSGGQG